MRRLDLIPVLALVGCAPGGYTRAEVVYAEPARRRRDRARVRRASRRRESARRKRAAPRGAPVGGPTPRAPRPAPERAARTAGLTTHGRPARVDADGPPLYYLAPCRTSS